MIETQLKIFLAVCEEGTMTAAAEKLYMTQPAVSQAIKALEEEYDTNLFDRFPRRLELTASGKALKNAAFDLLRQMDELGDQIRGGEEKVGLSIGMNLSVGKVLIYDYLEKFRSLHPDSQVRIFSTRGSELLKKLDQNELDFLLMEKPASDEDYICEPFFEDRITIVAASGDPVLKKKHKLEDLMEEPFFLRERGAGVREQFESLLTSKGLSVSPIWESSSTSVLVEALTRGERGLAVLPYQLIRRELSAGVLEEVSLSDVRLSRTLYIVRHRRKSLSAPARDFIEIVRSGEVE